MYELFDDNVLFLEGDAWHSMRKSLESLFDHESVARCLEETKSVVEEFFRNFSTNEPVVVYKTFKLLATRLSIALFLSHHTSPEDSQVIAELMTLHWRGIISVPVNMRGPWSLWQSGYSKALSAKDRLKAIIADIIKSRPSAIASSIEACCTEDKEAGLRHLLLFVSALIPKAFASILTSLVLELSKPENVRNTLRYALLSPITKLMSIRPDGESVQMTIHCWTTLF
jgi:cytochrome P450